MMRSFVFAISCLGLAACATHNPYQAESMGLDPAPPQAAHAVDYSAYPAPERQTQYQTWQWATPSIHGSLPHQSHSELELLVLERLDQQGLRPAQDASAEITVQLTIGQQQRLYQRQINPSVYYGGGVHRNRQYSRHGYSGVGIGADFPLNSESYRRTVTTFNLRLVDNQSGKGVWQGTGEVESEQPTRQQIIEALNQALKGYQ